MSTTNFDALDDKGMELSMVIGARFISVYTECSDIVKAVVDDMLDVIRDEEMDDDDRQMALSTLYEALFPNRFKGRLGMDIEQSESEAVAEDLELRQIVTEMDQQEKTFAENLGKLMRDRHLTQQQLASRIGVGQSAIANMLARSCRPQKQTVQRLAEALEVEPEELWPFG